jgi:hypothetical protein
MPEYKKGPFSLLPNPPYEELAIHSEVFQIWPSGEIFTNYEYKIIWFFQFFNMNFLDNTLTDFITMVNVNGLVSTRERVN